MALCSARLPPGGPVAAQAAVAGLGGFVGGKKGDFDVMLFQHVGNQGGDRHVAGVKG